MLYEALPTAPNDGADKLSAPSLDGLCSGARELAVIIMFWVIPMLAWAATLLAMKGYSLTGEKMKEIQGVNAARKQAVAVGLSLDEAMKMISAPEDIHSGGAR